MSASRLSEGMIPAMGAALKGAILKSPETILAIANEGRINEAYAHLDDVYADSQKHGHEPADEYLDVHLTIRAAEAAMSPQAA